MAKKTPDGDATAEKEFRKVLELSPGYASIAYTLGTLILRERKVERIPEALFYIARAVEISGPQALTADGKTAAETYLKKAYAGYHGDENGLDDVKKAGIDGDLYAAGLQDRKRHRHREETGRRRGGFCGRKSGHRSLASDPHGADGCRRRHLFRHDQRLRGPAGGQAL